VNATPERCFLWKEAIPRPAVRRLTRAAKDETPVHLFRRSQASTAFTYMGRSHVGTLTACTDGAYEVEFQLLQPQ
jgi:hypothetical protein